MEVQVAETQQRKREDALSPQQTASCPSGQSGMGAISLAVVVRRSAIARSTSSQRMGAGGVLETMGSHYPRNRLTRATKIHAMHGWIANSLSGASGRLATLLVELASKK